MTRERDGRARRARPSPRAGGAPVGVNVQLAPPTPGHGRARARSLRGAGAVPGGARPAARAARRPPGRPAARAGRGRRSRPARRVVDDVRGPRPMPCAARAAGRPLLAMVTTAAEARRAVAAGADGVIAQGAEAGGHRSAFVGAAVTGRVAGSARSRSCRRWSTPSADVPVVASRRDHGRPRLAAALALGAQGVSLGTRFLLARERRRRRLLPRGARAHARRTAPSSPTRHRPAGALDPQPHRRRARRGRPGTLGWGAQARADRRHPPRGGARRSAPTSCPCSPARPPALVGEPLPAAEIVEELVRETAAAQERVRAAR